MSIGEIGDIERAVEQLRQVLPDPFELRSKADVFFKSSIAQKLIAGGEHSSSLLVGFLESNPEPALARPAVLLLSQFGPVAFYPKLLSLIEKADRSMIEAFDAGLWFVHVPETQIARDLVGIVLSSGNPDPLLLLQRPVAKAVRSELKGFVNERRMPLSLYALYCYRYALEQEDIPFLSVVSKWIDVPELSALAGLYLLKLGSTKGLLGIRAGLLSPNEQLRTLTYYELSEYLPRTAVTQSNYDPVNPGDVHQAAIDVLLEHVGAASSCGEVES